MLSAPEGTEPDAPSDEEQQMSSDRREVPLDGELRDLRHRSSKVKKIEALPWRDGLKFEIGRRK